jgi:uncharacterized protein (TIGR02246 family)
VTKKILFLSMAVFFAGCTTTGTTRTDAVPAAAQRCQPSDERVITGLFERWNASLQTGDPQAVVNNYAERSILLPTLSGVNRISKDEKLDYFKHFLASKPVGTVTARQISLGCNTAVDSGLYTFVLGATGQQVDARYTFAYEWDGQNWLIVSHHSSALPASH